MEKKYKKFSLILIVFCFVLMLAIIVVLLINQSRTASRIQELESAAAEAVNAAAPETSAMVPESLAADTETQTEKPYASDTVAPVIEGVEDLTVRVGNIIAYRENVTVTDDMDPDPSLTVDVSHVNTDTVGNYYAIYIATDAAGNQSFEVANIHVVPLEVITSDEANAVADEILYDIIDEDMTDYEKIEAVFFYLHAIGYSERNYGDIHSYLDNAYYFLVTRIGDCRCFYAASRLLLERLGYTTQIVKSSEGSTRLHYWNLVSTDEGETWYHFDPTDWEWDDNGQFICMVTDEWLHNYSESHNYPALSWDPEYYPATPEYEFY